MKISSRLDYALSCLLCVADKYNKEPVTAEEIAKREHIEEDYVEQLLAIMRKAKIINSMKGPGGGYMLAKAPSKINMKDIIEAMENTVFEVVCFREKGRRNKCSHKNDCRLRNVWFGVRNEIESIFSKYDLETLLTQRKKEKNWK